MKKLYALLICLLMLASCNNKADYGKIFESEQSYDYEIYESEESYEIDGCVFDYKTYEGCERNDFEGVLKKNDDIICEYKADGYVWNYPEKAVNLFDDVYYIENREFENKETLFYIAKDGKIYRDFMQSDKTSKREQLEYISDFLCENITEQEIIDIFGKCGYDDTHILEIYRFKE